MCENFCQTTPTPLEPQSKPLSFTCVSILFQSSLYDWGVNRVHGELACLGGVSKLHLVMGPAELLNLISQWQADRQPWWQVLTLKHQPFLLAPSLCLPIHTWRICDFLGYLKSETIFTGNDREMAVWDWLLRLMSRFVMAGPWANHNAAGIERSPGLHWIDADKI